ncbi:MAG TPA: hypothetical protein VI670_15425, partial [Thermoanaerobaculia bacterium]
AMPPLSQRRHGRRTPQDETEPTPTNLAGLFFFLNLPIDEEQDPWQYLALLALNLEEEIEKDPIWPILETLAEEEIDRELEIELPDLRDLLPDIEDPLHFLLRRFGRVALTPAHVDVFFSLAAHPIEIRLSGLDRDPGWLLPAGRHVAFHFD